MSKAGAVGRGRVLLALCVLSVLWAAPWGCGRKNEERGQVAPEESASFKSDYAALFQQIGELQERVRANPADPELRRELVIAAVDTAGRRLWATGRGLAPSGAASRPAALQAAERAALTDAYRWVALLLKWKDDYRTPDFGSVEATVPGVQIVHRDTSGNEVRLLVEAPLR
ncbi:MAG: hypothetical protein QHJ34_15585 [bacterium]|jgi:hypothetical protein|nr:hypothetical protein [candidate division KSB1 bacterium]MDH7561623.1 hypothetical protein [bacterium]